jgi:hypothetical protein
MNFEKRPILDKTQVGQIQKTKQLGRIKGQNGESGADHGAIPKDCENGRGV